MADTFALQLAAFAEKAKGAPEQIAAKVSIDVLRNVVMRTPVGDPALWKHKPPPGYVGGRARANWNVSLGSPDLSTSAATDDGGQTTINAGAAVIGQTTHGQDVYIMNSLPYIRPLEYEGHSRQAPAGMVRVTVSEWQTYVDAAVAGLPK